MRKIILKLPIRYILMFCILQIVFILSSCKSTECLQQEQATYITNLGGDWPFMLIFNWWSPYAGNMHINSILVDSNGIQQKRLRGIGQSGQGNYYGCPVIYAETLDLAYSQLNPNNQSNPVNQTLWYPIAPFFVFETNNVYKPDQGSILIMENLPVDTGAYQAYVATYDLKTLTYKSLVSTGNYYGYSPSYPLVQPTSYPQNAIKIDSIQSFDKTYYNVWKFVVALNSYPQGYKTLYFDPTYGLIKEELNNGSIIDIQP